MRFEGVSSLVGQPAQLIDNFCLREPVPELRELVCVDLIQKLFKSIVGALVEIEPTVPYSVVELHSVVPVDMDRRGNDLAPDPDNVLVDGAP